jgi:predicted RNase H-like nuclease
MKRWVGVDACRRGWFAVHLDADSTAGFAVFDTFGALWDAYRKADRILVDIPIGLPEDAPREADAQARALLKARRASVFQVPVRAAVYALTYADASEQNFAAIGRRLSRQAWNITHSIRDVDGLLRITEAARARVMESHPEVVFLRLAGHEMRFNKKLPPGHSERLEALKAHFPSAPDLYEAALKAQRRSDVARDDILDALALAVAARGELRSVPETPPRDRHGLPMRIVFPK